VGLVTVELLYLDLYVLKAPVFVKVQYHSLNIQMYALCVACIQTNLLVHAVVLFFTLMICLIWNNSKIALKWFLFRTDIFVSMRTYNTLEKMLAVDQKCCFETICSRKTKIYFHIFMISIVWCKYTKKICEL